MTIEDVYNLTRETMKNWEVEPTYGSGVVEATYGSSSYSNFLTVTNFSVKIEVIASDIIGVTTDVLIDGAFSYSVDREFYTLDKLREYLNKLDKLGEDELSNARHEMSDALSAYFKVLF